MEELKDSIIRLVLFYTDVMLGVEKAYNDNLTIAREKRWSEESIAALEKTYESMCDESLKQMSLRASEIAAKYSIDPAVEDDLK